MSQIKVGDYVQFKPGVIQSTWNVENITYRVLQIIGPHRDEVGQFYMCRIDAGPEWFSASLFNQCLMEYKPSIVSY